MNFCTYTSVIALLLAGCLPPAGERTIPPAYIDQQVMEVEGWDVGCDNLGRCVAVAAVSPRKAKMNGIRGALRVELTHPDGLAAGITIIPLDFEQRLPDVKPTLLEAEKILETLRDGDEFLVWHDDTDETRYYLPAQGFKAVETVYNQYAEKFSARWVEQEAIMPTKGVRLLNYRAPLLTEEQLSDCTSEDKGSLKAAWDVGTQFRLFKYACSPKGAFSPETLWFTQRKQTGKLVPIGLAEAVGPKTDDKAAGLYNAYFEESQGLLVTRKFGPSDDCGLSATYAATPSGFVLAIRREARHCVGLFTGDWITTYRSSAVIMPDHW
jgi:hypothetical protein